MRAFSYLAASFLLVISCGDSKNVPPDSAPGSEAGREAKLPQDLPPLSDLPKKLPCESEWRAAIHAQNFSSKGAVATTDLTGGIKQTTVDATAGGINQATQNPYVYVSLEKGGQRVELDDFAARLSDGWDLALRRAVIRINGGDSGTGQGAIAILPGQTLEQVTAVPAASSFAADDFLDDKCQVKLNPIDDIWTAIGGSTGLWYEYDVGTSQVKPKPQAYVIRSGKGKHFKLVIDSYYKGTVGANYTLRWSPLP